VRRALFFVFLCWVYLFIEGSALAFLPWDFPPPALAVLMVLYAALNPPLGPFEALSVGLVADLLLGAPFGLGGLSKLLLFLALRRFAYGVEMQRPLLFVLLAFPASLADILLQEAVLLLGGPRSPIDPLWAIASSGLTVALAWPVFYLTRRALRPFEGKGREVFSGLVRE